MKEIIDIDHIREILFEGLCKLTEFCESYNITCFLAFGTLLGAVRYGDYIPWDDDVDVMLLREDYDRLAELTEEIESDEWHLLSYKKVNGYDLPWMKFSHKNSAVLPPRFNSGYIYGLSIDVFPIDCLDANDLDTAIREAESLNHFYKTAVKKYKPFGTLKTGFFYGVKRFGKCLYYNACQEIMGSIKKLYITIEAERRTAKRTPDSYCCHIFARVVAVFPMQAFFGDNVELQFHGHFFTVPPGYKDILTARYGANYMEPPPIEKRISEHIYTACRL